MELTIKRASRKLKGSNRVILQRFIYIIILEEFQYFEEEKK
jgi:hypothetical protein